MPRCIQYQYSNWNNKKQKKTNTDFIIICGSLSFIHFFMLSSCELSNLKCFGLEHLKLNLVTRTHAHTLSRMSNLIQAPISWVMPTESRVASSIPVNNTNKLLMPMLGQLTYPSIAFAETLSALLLTNSSLSVS